ncbi:MAG: type II toxin-antitoxin system HicA family toxin [Candidatus Hydrothermarchaeales archaeon]
MKLKPLPPNKVIKTLEKMGFQKVRQKGSHIFMRHPDGRTTLIPVYRGEDIGKGLLRKIIRDVKAKRGEFLKLAEEV